MPATAQVRVVYNRFPRLAGVTRATAEAVLDRSCARIAAAAKQKTPPRVDTGAMMNGYVVERTGAQTRAVSNRMPYHLFQELGTSTIAPHPMLVPAAEEERPRYASELADTLAAAWAAAR
jgi:HK97 gp10 family phage protein